MKHQQGSSLVVALILLTIITLVAVYSLEGSNIQSKMVANSLFSNITYQECRNEQEANVRFYNIGDNSGVLNLLANTGGTLTEAGIRSNAPIKSESLVVTWNYMGAKGIGSSSGEAVDSGNQSTNLVLELGCVAIFSFATNSQSLGVRVKSLKIAGKVI